MVIWLLLGACATPRDAADLAVVCAPLPYRRPSPTCVDLFLCSEPGLEWFQPRPPAKSARPQHFPVDGCPAADGPCLTTAQRSAESWACR